MHGATTSTPTISASQYGQPCLVLQLPLDVGADHPDRAEGEVEHARAAVDDHQALRGERVERADPEAQQGEPDDFLHCLADSSRVKRGARGPGHGARGRRCLRYRTSVRILRLVRPRGSDTSSNSVVSGTSFPFFELAEDHGAVEQAVEALRDHRSCSTAWRSPAAGPCPAGRSSLFRTLPSGTSAASMSPLMLSTIWVNPFVRGPCAHTAEAVVVLRGIGFVLLQRFAVVRPRGGRDVRVHAGDDVARR